MPRQSKWTRGELAAADATAEMMGLTRATVLKRYTTENRRIQAAEHGMSVEEWVEANLAADRFLETVETMHQRGEGAAAIAKETGKPEADIRKIVAGIVGDHVEQPRRPMPAGPARSLDLTSGFSKREEGITVEEREARARAAKTIIDAQQAMVDAALNGPPYPDPTALPKPKFIIRRPEKLRTPPRKERHQEAQDRALGLSMQLHVSMRTAWKYYDEANAERIEQEDDMAWTVFVLHREGKPAEEIAEMTGVRVDEVTSFIAQLPRSRD